eukprot:s2866_g2.t1
MALLLFATAQVFAFVVVWRKRIFSTDVSEVFIAPSPPVVASGRAAPRLRATLTPGPRARVGWSLIQAAGVEPKSILVSQAAQGETSRKLCDELGVRWAGPSVMSLAVYDGEAPPWIHYGRSLDQAAAVHFASASFETLLVVEEDLVFSPDFPTFVRQLTPLLSEAGNGCDGAGVRGQCGPEEVLSRSLAPRSVFAAVAAADLGDVRRLTANRTTIRNHALMSSNREESAKALPLLLAVSEEVGTKSPSLGFRVKSTLSPTWAACVEIMEAPMEPALQLPSARICLLKELAENPAAAVGASVRVTGEVKEFQQIDPSRQPMLLMQDRGATLLVDGTAAVRAAEILPGRSVQAVGELERRGDFLVLRARILRVVDMDLQLYERCLAVRRQFESKYL